MLDFLDEANPVLVGVLAGSLPTISMLLCSLMAVNTKFSSTFESSAQNYCAGLILGAVAKELFPQIDTNSKHDNLVGITAGFFIGCFFVNYLDYFVTWVEGQLDSLMKTNGVDNSPSVDVSAEQLESQQLLIQVAPQHASYNSLESLPRGGATNTEGSDAGSEPDGDVPLMMLAQQAVASPMHRQRIRMKVAELVTGISSMEQKSRALHGYLNHGMPPTEAEVYADQIDEEIHHFQYMLDNCRRLIQGSCSNIEGVVPRLWITDKGIATVKRRLSALKSGAQGIYQALQVDQLSTEALVEIHVAFDRMDMQLDDLHKAVEGYSFKWGRRSKKRMVPVPNAGSFIPMTLMVPVVVDCIVDGFLVGTTSAISTRAGIILGVANMIEMGFLGLAVSLRVRKCTGSSTLARYTSLILPPLIMLAAALVGALGGSAARSHPVVYIGFISFGIVALLYLVVNELLVEAREAQSGKEYWWTAMVLFVGIYSVVLLDMLV